MDFGDGLRIMRAVRKMSQTELAERLGCSQMLVSCIETGKALPTDDMQKRIREALDWPVGFVPQAFAEVNRA